MIEGEDCGKARRSITTKLSTNPVESEQILTVNCKLRTTFTHSDAQVAI